MLLAGKVTAEVSSFDKIEGKEPILSSLSSGSLGGSIDDLSVAVSSLESELVSLQDQADNFELDVSGSSGSSENAIGTWSFDSIDSQTSILSFITASYADKSYPLMLDEYISWSKGIDTDSEAIAAYGDKYESKSCLVGTGGYVLVEYDDIDNCNAEAYDIFLSCPRGVRIFYYKCT